MSKDWTPQQFHAVDKSLNGDLSSQTLSAEIEGKTYVIHDPNSEDGKAFPNLYFLGNDIYKVLKKECSITFVYDVEMMLAEIINIVDGFKSPLSSIDDETLKLSVKPEHLALAMLVRDWFEGKLDPGFYYNEWNNEVFAEKLLEHYKSA